MLALTASLCASPAMDDAVARISLFNPTAWRGPALIEIATGRIAAPGLIDWANVRLMAGDEEVPFALREGCAHGRASLAPLDTPRAEDLLVFWHAVEPSQWCRLRLVEGTPKQESSVDGRDGLLTISYATVRAVLDKGTGALVGLDMCGESILAQPMAAAFRRVNNYACSGPIGPGYTPYTVTVDKGDAVPTAARLAAVASTPAMTEVHFVLEGQGGPAVALTYRVHAAGLVEVVADERPWAGASPWLDHAFDVSLALNGESESLAYLEDRWPFYGFKDYTAVVRQVARRYALGSVGVLELGEEFVNGRRWMRRLYTYAADGKTCVDDLIEQADEGFVVDVEPVRAAVPADAIEIAFPPEAREAANMLERVLAEAGVAAKPVAEATSDNAIRLELVDTSGINIERDGFEIRSVNDALSIRARTPLGLDQAVRRIAADVRLHGLDTGFPLIARNPVVPLRVGGFGGGPFEVDFPYGTDEEWERTFDGLLDSGMNTFCCLGMWGNWKLPISYTHMPEIRSEDAQAYDESSGVLFSELDKHRAHGLKLTQYLHDRGARVWDWVPIGCVPTTFAKRYPEAMSTIGETRGQQAAPCFTHPTYRNYLDAFLKELVETYALDGVFLVRDDNGGLCACERCQAYVAESRTKDAVWEQYLYIYDRLRELGFTGAICVYPYFDGYVPAKLEPHLPEDLFVGGHGASAALLTRDLARVGPMADTWLDNLYMNFRLPPSPRMRRLLSDRCSFWIGGAYCGTELPWEAIGYFGWEPTATPNTFRYEWGARTFGRENALAFLAVSDAYERLWEINARSMLPRAWMELDPAQRTRVTEEASALVSDYADRLDALRQAVDAEAHATWFAHMGLFPVFFEYHLYRLDRFAEVYTLVEANNDALNRGAGLPAAVRSDVLAKYADIYARAAKYDAALREVPGHMLEACRNHTMPYKEWMAGYDAWLDPCLDRPQFAGTLRASPTRVIAGEPFTLRVELRNTGVCPWVAEAGQRLELSGVAQQLGLPASWTFTGDAMASGDVRMIEFAGTAPIHPGSGEIALAFFNAYRQPTKCAEATVGMAWMSKGE